MDYESQQWEAVNKGLTTLMVAHAAGMVTCLTLIKDYKDTGPLKGVGVFVWLFGSGLITAIVAAFLWLVLRGPYTGRSGKPHALLCRDHRVVPLIFSRPDRRDSRCHLQVRPPLTETIAPRQHRAPGAAQDLRKFARTFLEWCVRTGRAIHNVLAGLRQPKRSRAERLKAASNGGRALSDDQIRKLWQTAADFGAFGALVRLALLTGARRGELAGLERSHLLADRLVVVPEHAKTGTQHEVPLTPLMRAVIAGEPITTAPLVFLSSKTGGRIKGWTKLVAKLQQVSGVDFRLHDLRRTARTLMSRLGVAEDIAELAIGHVRVDLIARYNKDQAWEGRSDAFARVSAHVAALIGAREGAAAALRRLSRHAAESTKAGQRALARR